MQNELKTQVINWLQSIGATTWVRYDITDNKEVGDAADWFLQQIELFNQHLTKTQTNSDYKYWAEQDSEGVYVTDGHTKAYMCGLEDCDLRFINENRTTCGGVCAEHDTTPRFVTPEDEAAGTLADQTIPEDWVPDAFGD